MCDHSRLRGRHWGWCICRLQLIGKRDHAQVCGYGMWGIWRLQLIAKRIEKAEKKNKKKHGPASASKMGWLFFFEFYRVFVGVKGKPKGTPAIFSGGGSTKMTGPKRSLRIVLQGTVGFSPFHLPGFHFGYIFLTHSHVFDSQQILQVSTCSGADPPPLPFA